MTTAASNMTGNTPPLVNQDLINTLTNTSNTVNALYNKNVNAAPDPGLAQNLYQQGISGGSLAAQTPGTSYGMSLPVLQNLGGLFNSLGGHIEGVNHAVTNNPMAGEIGQAQAQQGINQTSGQALGQMGDMGLNGIAQNMALINAPIATAAAAPFSLMAQTNARLAGLNNGINMVQKMSDNVDAQPNLSYVEKALLKNQYSSQIVNNADPMVSQLLKTYANSTSQPVDATKQAGITKMTQGTGYIPAPNYRFANFANDITQQQGTNNAAAGQLDNTLSQVDSFDPAIAQAQKLGGASLTNNLVSVAMSRALGIPAGSIPQTFDTGNVASTNVLNAYNAATGKNFTLANGQGFPADTAYQILKAQKASLVPQAVNAAFGKQITEEAKNKPFYNNPDFGTGLYDAPDFKSVYGDIASQTAQKVQAAAAKSGQPLSQVIRQLSGQKPTAAPIGTPQGITGGANTTVPPIIGNAPATPTTPGGL